MAFFAYPSDEKYRAALARDGSIVVETSAIGLAVLCPGTWDDRLVALVSSLDVEGKLGWEEGREDWPKYPRYKAPFPNHPEWQIILSHRSQYKWLVFSRMQDHQETHCFTVGTERSLGVVEVLYERVYERFGNQVDVDPPGAPASALEKEHEEVFRTMVADVTGMLEKALKAK